MKYKIISLLFFLISVSLSAEEMPKYLYKIISVQTWNESQGKEAISLSEMDRSFIHLATETQVDKIATKFFKDEREVVVLTLETTLLPGKLILEANPGGTTKYYHLYNGSIPLHAVKCYHRLSL